MVDSNNLAFPFCLVSRRRPMRFLQKTSDTYISYGLEQSGLLYQTGIAAYIDSYATVRVATLAAFLAICFLLFVFFYNPMCWQLDAEQKRTSAMLLLIPPDIMERIPSIRDFVQKLDG